MLINTSFFWKYLSYSCFIENPQRNRMWNVVPPFFSFQLKTLTQINASFHHYIDLTFRISDKLGFNRKRIPVHIMLYFLLRFGALPIHNSYDLRTLENIKSVGNIFINQCFFSLQRTIFMICFYKHIFSFHLVWNNIRLLSYTILFKQFLPIDIWMPQETMY